MTRQGHGLYALAGPDDGFADLRVGVLANGFLPQWMNFLGYDTSAYPRKKARSASDLDVVPDGIACSLRDLFASMPEIDDLFTEVFGGPPAVSMPAIALHRRTRRKVLRQHHQGSRCANEAPYF